MKKNFLISGKGKDGRGEGFNKGEKLRPHKAHLGSMLNPHDKFQLLNPIGGGGDFL